MSINLRKVLAVTLVGMMLLLQLSAGSPALHAFLHGKPASVAAVDIDTAAPAGPGCCPAHPNSSKANEEDSPSPAHVCAVTLLLSGLVLALPQPAPAWRPCLVGQTAVQTPRLPELPVQRCASARAPPQC